jgi:hypothetical protein
VIEQLVAAGQAIALLPSLGRLREQARTLGLPGA